MQNEPPEWCPQWAWDEAYRLASQVVAERGARMETFQPIVARALVAAERRGLDRSAKFVVEFARAGARDRAEMHDKRMVNLFAQMEAVLPASIRQLGEEP